jgi:hypothetical protein
MFYDASQSWRSAVMRKRVDRSSADYLSASEIGTYAFCPEAWFHERRGTARSTSTSRRLAAGSLAHWRIGRQTDRLRTAERWRTLLGLLIVALAVFIVVRGWASA